jgi:DNA polymerase-3 subunit epsilon
MELAVIDLETTGTSAERDRVVEIAVVRTRGPEVVETWSSLVRPGVSVGESERVHAISDAMLVSAPSLGELAARFHELVSGATVVAHRAAFDVGFLEAAARRGELRAITSPVADTAVIADRALGENRLAALARRIGGRRPEHRALPDAFAALDVLRACLDTLGPIDAAELADLSASRASMRSEVVRALRSGLETGVPISVIYRPASGRVHDDLLHVESLAPPYVVGSFEHKRGRRTLRGDRFVRAWSGARPVMRFFDGDRCTEACVDVGGSRP